MYRLSSVHQLSLALASVLILGGVVRRLRRLHRLRRNFPPQQRLWRSKRR